MKKPTGKMTKGRKEKEKRYKKEARMLRTSYIERKVSGKALGITIVGGNSGGGPDPFRKGRADKEMMNLRDRVPLGSNARIILTPVSLRREVPSRDNQSEKVTDLGIACYGVGTEEART